MPVFQVPDESLFPPTALAEPSGVLAIGGDLSPRRLLRAYASGIFPWYSDGQPILWHAPPQRMVLLLDELRVNRTTRKAMRKMNYALTLDSAFDCVVACCARAKRPDQEGTWITTEMAAAYAELHRLGVAHSVEVWREHEDGADLVGGLYGVSLGACFFGESMFSIASNTSKYAFVRLVEQLQRWNFQFIDCQVWTPLLSSLGASEMEREGFEALLAAALTQPTRQGEWKFDSQQRG